MNISGGRPSKRIMLPIFGKPPMVPGMKTGWILVLAAVLASLPLDAQSKRTRSLLDNDPDVIYLERSYGKPVELTVAKEAPVFSDKEGRHRLGTLKANQTVRLEAITDRIYRVRGEGTRHGIAGWVAPWAFTSKDPQFVTHLKDFYDRQIVVERLIDANQAAVGMTLDEVSRALGKPVKTTVRKTEKGQSGTWEFIEYDEVRHFITRVDPVSGLVYRQFSHMTQTEKSRTAVEFADDVVTAIEESEDRQRGGNVRIVVPPLIFGW
jgi:hypothetical protein